MVRKRNPKLPPLCEILSIDAKVERLLGKTANQIAKMTLSEFAELSYDKGIIWTVSPDGGRVMGLTISAAREEKASL